MENLEEIVPDGVFGYGSVLFRRLLDDGGEFAAAAVFHENIENPASLSTYRSWHRTMWP